MESSIMRTIFFLVLAAMLGACASAEIGRTDGDGMLAGDSGADGDTDADGDSDADADTDADGDADGDTDGDADGDADGDTDTGTGTGTGPAEDTDTTCGGLTQPCCGDTCDDDATLVCVGDYPSAGDAFCWNTCALVPCTTLEDYTDGHCVNVSGTGICTGIPDSIPAETCDLFPCTQGGCYSYQGYSFCFDEDCDYTSTCTGGLLWCQKLVGGTGACLP
jgi:hypothetical protein